MKTSEVQGLRGWGLDHLRTQLFLAALPIVLIFVVFNFSRTIDREASLLRQERLDRAQVVATLLARTCLNAIETLDPVLLQSNVNNQFVQDGVLYLEVLDAAGNVVAADDPLLVGRPPLLRPPDPSVVDVTAAIRSADRTLGSVRLGLSTVGYLDAVARARWQLQWLSAVLLVGVLVLTGMAARRLSRPLESLARAGDLVAEGYLATRAREEPGHALGDLPRTFNDMAERLERRVKAEREARIDLQRRVGDLVAFTAAVARGDLARRADVPVDDELGKLAESFNRMVERLGELMAQEESSRGALERSGAALASVHARLSHLDRQKTDFLIVVSHELRTPLTSVKAFAELLREDDVEDPELRAEFLGIIHREADRLTRLINNLLDLSRIEAGRMNWRRERISVSRMARQAVEGAQAAAREKHVRLQVLVADEREIDGDGERLSQALSQIIQNAVNASPEGESVRIATCPDPDCAHLVVEDRGPGIEARYREAIFERFWQILPEERKGDERPKGSGLGLPLARAIVEAHSGQVEVESEPGKGSLFHLVVPLKPGTMRVRGLGLELRPITERLLGKPLDFEQWRSMVQNLLEPGSDKTSQG